MSRAALQLIPIPTLVAVLRSAERGAAIELHKGRWRARLSPDGEWFTFADPTSAVRHMLGGLADTLDELPSVMAPTVSFEVVRDPERRS